MRGAEPTKDNDVVAMDLSRLPDAAKLAILSHLAGGGHGGSAAASTSSSSRVLAACAARGASPGHETSTLPPRVPRLLQGRVLQAGMAVVDGFADANLVLAARREATALLGSAEQSREAGMGGALGAAKWRDARFRGDRHAWLHADRLREQGCAALPTLLDRLLAEVGPWLAAQGFNVRGRPTCQVACYPGGGARYVRHSDWQPVTAPHRTATALVYLTSPGWDPTHDGGALCVYGHHGAPADAAAAGDAALRTGLDDGLPGTVVAPLPGRLVVFDSRLVHEVLPTHAERCALTCWFSRVGTGTSAAGPAADAAGAQPTGEGAAGADAAGEGAAGGRAAADDLASQLRGASLDEVQGERQAAGTGQEPGGAATLEAAHPRGDAATPAQEAGSIRPTPGLGLLAPEPAPGAGAVTRPRHIFVSIASYRDSETQWTLADMFARAAQPELIRVGIVWQVNWQQDSAFVRIADVPPGSSDSGSGGGSNEQQWQRQVRQVVVDAGEATGPCKARQMAAGLWDGEEYVLQVDSHMRFAPGWDASLHRQLAAAEAAAGDQRVVLSTYPPGYDGKGAAARLPPDPLPAVLCASHVSAEDGLLRLRARKLAAWPAAPLPSLFWAAGLSFGRAGVLAAAPYRRDLPGLFFSEELLQLLQLRRAGWRVFAPCEVVAYHLWSRAHRPSFHACGTADEEAQRAVRTRSQEAVRTLLEGLEGQALGRDVGVDFKARTISKKALNGGLPPEAFLAA
eukprot:scaffold1.g5631.t1